MKIIDTKIPDVKILVPKKFKDNRGFFYESFNSKNFQKLIGKKIKFVQDNHSKSKRGVIRGLHYQKAPYAQDKLVRCLSGSILDVAVDIRKDSMFYGKHIAKVISAENFEQILVPKGFAHGFLTLEKNTIINYKVSNYYSFDNDHGLYWADPELAIDWGINVDEAILSEKDANQPFFKDLSTPF